MKRAQSNVSVSEVERLTNGLPSAQYISPERIHVGLIHVLPHHPFHDIEALHTLLQAPTRVVLGDSRHTQKEDIQLSLSSSLGDFFLEFMRVAAKRVSPDKLKHDDVRRDLALKQKTEIEVFSLGREKYAACLTWPFPQDSSMGTSTSRK